MTHQDRRTASHFGMAVGGLINSGHTVPSLSIRFCLRCGSPHGGKAPPVDLAEKFGRTAAEIHLEIGFGAGEHLSGVAAAAPDVDFIGCEPFINGVALVVGRYRA